MNFDLEFQKGIRYISVAVALDRANPGLSRHGEYNQFLKELKFREQTYCYKSSVDMPEHQHRQLLTKYLRDDVLHQVFD